MKKIFSIILIFIFSILMSAFAEEKKLFGGDAGLVFAIPVYGDTSSPFSNRVLLGADGDISLTLGTPLKLMLGADLISDINWDGNKHKNHLDYAGWFGIKVYPGIAGLDAYLAYALGARTDYIEEEYENELGEKQKKSVTETTAWGNGFKLGIEYDFLHGSERKTMPAIGFFYRMMPRGSKSYDNIFAFYVNMVF